MAKTIAVASKFSGEEIDRIDYFVQKNNTSRSALIHDLVMQGITGEQHHVQTYSIPSNVQEVTFRFVEDYAYFWKGKTYKGIINGEDASVYFGGEWKNYKFADLPVEVLS